MKTKKVFKIDTERSSKFKRKVQSLNNVEENTAPVVTQTESDTSDDEEQSIVLNNMEENRVSMVTQTESDSSDDGEPPELVSTDEIVPTDLIDVNGSVPQLVDEYAEGDTSDEEDIRNTVGNIPMNWYEFFDHIGYDVEGQKIMKPAKTDEIDEHLRKMDDPNYWITVKNRMTGEKVVLNEENLAIIKRIQSGKFPTGEDMFQPFEDFITYETMQHPVTNHPPHKRSFIPSKIEKAKVSRLVHAIKMGWIKPKPPRVKNEEYYNMWDDNDSDEVKRLQNYIPAPKRKLPGHEESYIPPKEYLFTKEEEEKWKEQDPEERKLDFIPKRCSSLRLVPSYETYTQEWFNRCLDLYLCPRQRKMRVNVDPNDLIPQLPKRKDLQPFPSLLALVYTGHTGLIRCICVEPTGQFMASGSDDKTIKIWEILTGRCLATIDVGGPVNSIAWCPNPSLCLILAAVGDKVHVINPKVGDKEIVKNTDMLLATFPDDPERKVALWGAPNKEEENAGIRLTIVHTKSVKQVSFHAKGDYFACLVSDIGYKSIVIHQLSKFRSQVPFKKMKGNLQTIAFHPLRPLFFVATQKHVKIFNLLKQEMTKVVTGNCQWISSIAVHPQGDNLLLGSYDCKLSWFDLELSSKPYKTLKNHKKAIRAVAFHHRYPLFASSSDDGSVIVSHGMVYSDLLQNPLIVPLKNLKNHGMCLDICFHPKRPWIFTTSDKTIRLYS